MRLKWNTILVNNIETDNKTMRKIKPLTVFGIVYDVRAVIIITCIIIHTIECQITITVILSFELAICFRSAAYVPFGGGKSARQSE